MAGERRLTAKERGAIISWIRERPVLPRAEWDRLDDQARRRAFTVATSTQLNVVRAVWHEADRALAEDLTFDQFQMNAMKTMAARWGDENAPALLAMMESNLQAAYNAGRFVELLRPERLATRPFFKFDPIMDYRTSMMCWHRAGIVRRHDDPFWATSWPPLHVRCRSSIRALTPGMAEASGGLGKAEPPERPQPGWGHPPRLEEFFPSQEVREDHLQLLGVEETAAISFRYPPPLFKAYHEGMEAWRRRIPELRDDLREQRPGSWSTVEGAEEWARANFPRVSWRLQGAALELLTPALLELLAMVRAWPDAALTLHAVELHQELEEQPAALSTDRRQLWLSPRWYGRAEVWEEEASQHVAGWSTPAGAITWAFGRLLPAWLRGRREGLLRYVAPDGFGRVDRVLAIWQAKIRATRELSPAAVLSSDHAFAEGVVALRWLAPAAWPTYVQQLQQLLGVLRGGVEAWLPAEELRTMRQCPPSERTQAKQDQLALALRVGLTSDDL